MNDYGVKRLAVAVTETAIKDYISAYKALAKCKGVSRDEIIWRLRPMEEFFNESPFAAIAMDGFDGSMILEELKAKLEREVNV